MREKYINKWFTHSVCGYRIIIKITGFDESNRIYEGPHFIGKEIMISPAGSCFEKKWAYYEEAFYSAIKSGSLKEFDF